jgi:hypothetical protein
MRYLLRSTWFVLLSVSLLGPVAAEAQTTELPPKTPKSVLGIHDTGINPYHQVFRTDDPYAFEHPSTYIPGYPADAQALPITLPGTDDERTWTDLVQEDCEIWKSVQPRKLYWIPGTRIVGAVSFNGSATPSCSSIQTGGTEILDYGGHGTMTASRAASNDYGACLATDCRLVAIQTPLQVNSTQAEIDAIRWAADNGGWLDGQSNSWGPFVPLWEPTGAAGLYTANPALVREIERANQKHAAFWASGNGVAFRFGVLGHPTVLAAHFGINGYIVGGHDSGYVNTWPGFSPHVVADSCNAWGARNKSVTDSADTVSGGTSGATPFVAGGAAKILLEARTILGDLETGFAEGGIVASGPAGLVPSGPLADGRFTALELRSVLLNTATARPGSQWEDGPRCTDALYGSTSVKWTDVPAQYPEFVQIGYGAVDRVAQALAVRVIKGEVAIPNRSTTDAYFSADDQARRVLYEVWSKP